MTLENEIAKSKEHIKKISKCSKLTEEQKEELLIEFLIEKRDAIQGVVLRMVEKKVIPEALILEFRSITDSATAEAFTRREQLIRREVIA